MIKKGKFTKFGVIQLGLAAYAQQHIHKLLSLLPHYKNYDHVTIGYDVIISKFCMFWLVLMSKVTMKMMTSLLHIPQKIYNSSGTSIIFSRHLKRNIFFSIES